MTPTDADRLATLTRSGDDLRLILEQTGRGATSASIISALRRRHAAADMERREAATLAGMERGTSGWNEVMGYDLTPPEPCGHHCLGNGCRRCCDYDEE